MISGGRSDSTEQRVKTSAIQAALHGTSTAHYLSWSVLFREATDTFSDLTLKTYIYTYVNQVVNKTFIVSIDSSKRCKTTNNYPDQPVIISETRQILLWLAFFASFISMVKRWSPPQGTRNPNAYS